MKSKYSEYFNHDNYAEDYDEDVGNEKDPIRAGYADVMKWAGEQVDAESIIIDLGCGTGNTLLAVKDYKSAFCVDVSEKMIKIAREKLPADVQFIKTDILDFFDGFDADFDVCISTYCIHHLIQEEKHRLFQIIGSRAKKGCKLVFGDLMYENNEEEMKLRAIYPDMQEEFDDEFFWNVDQETKILKNKGFKVDVKRFSDLSWGILAIKI